MASKPTEVTPPAAHKSFFGSCWSCRVLSGMGLIGSGIYVYLGPRRIIKQGTSPTFWHISQLAFAVGLLSWGLVVITDPVGKQIQKDKIRKQ
ncbi:distal membrane-arm assembly complex protein 1 [Paroedura picta]|uniref:distal membrane-arm assembly complex protein 1 n=1 Tax=Paroedura picta TaxID=143630 RepID=UPI004056F55F